MNDTVYGVSPGLVLHEMYTVGCGKVNCGKAARGGALGYDLGAPFLTIVTCVIVGATIGRPQSDRSLCRERPRIRLTIAWEHTVLPYGINVADEFTDGGVRAEGELPEGQEKPLWSAPPYGIDKTYSNKQEQRPTESRWNAVISLHFYQICEVNTL